MNPAVMDAFSRVRAMSSGSATFATKEEASDLLDRIYRSWPSMPYGTRADAWQTGDGTFRVTWSVGSCD